MDALNNIFGRVVNLLEQDNRGVQLGCYSVALIGLTVAIRKVRPFSRFRQPSDIPNHFIKERRELSGLVERIEPNGALLMIRHKPLVAIPGLPDGQLPVKISGVDVSGLGVNWLQAIVAGSEVKFIPVAKSNEFVQCQVLLSQIHNNKEQIINVGESLVRIGFGHVVQPEQSIVKDRTYLSYRNRLQVAENYALRKKLGAKYYIQPAKSAFVFVGKRLNRFAADTIRQIVQIPKLPSS